MLSGCNREIRRSVETISAADGRDQTATWRDLPVDQHVDRLVLGLTIGKLGGLERDVVRAGNQVDGLAYAAIALNVSDLGAVGGSGIVEGESGAVVVHAGLSRELPGRTGGR